MRLLLAVNWFHKVTWTRRALPKVMPCDPHGAVQRKACIRFLESDLERTSVVNFGLNLITAALAPRFATADEAIGKRCTTSVSAHSLNSLPVFSTCRGQ